MKRSFTALLRLLLIIGCLGFGKSFAQTTVWVVRHAEKDVSDPKNADPPLSDAGTQRAKDLDTYLADQRVAAIYSTKYKRTQATGAPLAARAGLTIISYDPKDPGALAKEVVAAFRGKSVLVVGHSNTVLELVEAFGGKRPVKALSDEDYDYLFKVTVADNGEVKTASVQYGAKHRDVPVTGTTNR
ncbi:SixA phosphatase family protein [Hufsiella ginkgonis]|uniref:Histidine phosphatase family protein n=1 Tax=Hufsiella ginkgonis TaxID=2695274 RepID=A0A7K1XTW2_9SPHI|nr:histidine phosphatase family protein [Hufsiella ginkgonis]MXV14237.1 histidine phosphatase family protein [Hufsiella ginkgonis]